MSNLYSAYDDNVGVTGTTAAVSKRVAACNRQQLAYALCLSDEMLKAAREGDWLTVEILDDERRHLLSDDIFEAEGTEAQLLADAISALIQVNHEISSLAEGVRGSLLEQHNYNQAVKKATQSYATVASV